MARVCRMCEGTGVNPWHCVCSVSMSVRAKIFASSWSFCDNPNSYEFALAIIEGKPVFRGDKLWCLASNHEFTVKGLCNSGLAFEYLIMFEHRQCVAIDSVSWNPSLPKTVMVELTIEDASSISTGETQRMFDIINLNDRVTKACKKALDSLKGS